MAQCVIGVLIGIGLTIVSIHILPLILWGLGFIDMGMRWRTPSWWPFNRKARGSW